VLWVLGLLKETIKSCMFGKKHLHCCGNFERKWFIKDIYGCYGKNLLLCPTFKGERLGALTNTIKSFHVPHPKMG
jgi:hypothetical protein